MALRFARRQESEYLVFMSRMLKKKKNKVLIIEDDHDIRVCFRDILESNNFEISSATNGRDAFGLLHSMKEIPDVIVTDLSMPFMDGNEFVTLKNRDEKFRDIPVIIVSAHVQKVAVADVYVMPKPVDLEMFVHQVREHVPHQAH